MMVAMCREEECAVRQGCGKGSGQCDDTVPSPFANNSSVQRAISFSPESHDQRACIYLIVAKICKHVFHV